MTLPPMLAKELSEGIVRQHLQAFADEISSHATECYALVTEGVDSYSTVGNSRFGGDPDLPLGMDWPTPDWNDEKTYSNFVAQINFAELPPLATDQSLPTNGILYIFVNHMLGASEPVILDAIYFEGDKSTLRRCPTPPELSLTNQWLVSLIPQRVRAVPAVSIESCPKLLQRRIAAESEVIDGDPGMARLYKLHAELKRPQQIGQMLGFAHHGQENIYRLVVLARLNQRRLQYDDWFESIEDFDAFIQKLRDMGRHDIANIRRHALDGVIWLQENREMINRHVREWRLLFRLDSNLPMRLEINDFDPLYVFIRHEDLACRDFSNLAGEVTQN